MMSEDINDSCIDDTNKSNRSGFFVRKYRFLDSSTNSPPQQQQPQQQGLSTSFNDSLLSVNEKSLMTLSMESSISECIPKSDENSSDGGSSSTTGTTTEPHTSTMISTQQQAPSNPRKIEIPKLKSIPHTLFKPSPANHQPHHHGSARVQSASSRSSFASKTVSNPSTYFSSLVTVRNQTESKASTTTAPYPTNTSKQSERSLDSSLSSTTYQFHSGKVQSPPTKPQSASNSGRKSFNSIQVSWKDARQTLRNSFSASYSTPKSTKKYNSFISEEPQDCTYDSSFMSTPKQATTIYGSDCDSSTNSIVTASPIPNIPSYEDVVNHIEQENDLESVESYQTGTTLNEVAYWDQSDLLLRTGIMVREPQLSPNSEYLLNSTYMKLKLTSPRVYESLVKQIEIEGPTERLPHSPIVKEVEKFYFQKEQPKKQLAYPLLPPVQGTIPATPSFEKPGSKEKRESKIRLRVEKELLRSQQMNEFRNKQRMLYKEDLEISREQEIAQYEMFKKQKLKDLKKKMSGSPFLIDMEAHAKKTEKELKRAAKIKEKLRVMENKKKEDLRKCELIERIIEKSKEDVHTTRRNILEHEREMKVIMSSTRLNK